MTRIRICEDLEECRSIWQRTWPHDSVFDLWDVRWCFAQNYHNTPYFIIAEGNNNIEGLIALCKLKEQYGYSHFPGELWQGKTWLEQNKIIAATMHTAKELYDAVPEPSHIRYLLKTPTLKTASFMGVDETGYILMPRQYNFSFDLFFQEFSGKSRKKLHREISCLEKAGISYRYNRLDDIEYLFCMNLNNFGPWSYFYEQRFKTSFEHLIAFLSARGYLRITTILIGGTIAAVDFGAVWNNTYTVLAGGTNPEFPGIAKVINFHHIRWAYANRIELVDFLCGDFGWKKRFHLTPRPLYEIRKPLIGRACTLPVQKESTHACVY